MIVTTNLVELTHWRFASIGDEGAFFDMAKFIAGGGSWNLFDLQGVYETHPVLDSAYQALVLKLFGVDIVGWRIAGILVLAASALLLYSLALVLFGRLPAIVAALVLGCNHYLMAFARIGYNNLHCIFYALLAMTCLVFAWCTGRTLYVFVTGCALGFCLYTFAVAWLTWPLVALLVAVESLRRPSVRGLVALGIVVAGFALVVVPALCSTPPGDLLDMVVHQSRREVAAEQPWMVARISLVQSFLAFWVNPQWFKHYVGGPLLDAVSCVLFSIGLALGLLKIRSATARIGVVWFVMGVVLVALMNYVPGPFFTRLLFVVPACSLLAAMAVSGLQAALGGLRVGGRLTAVVALGLALVIPPLNLHQLLVRSPRVLPVNAHMLTVKALQENPGRTIIEVGDELDRNRLEIVRRYPGLRSSYRFSSLVDLAAELRESRAGPEGPIYLVHDEALVSDLLQALPSGYRPRTYTARGGEPKIWLFVPEGADD